MKKNRTMVLVEGAIMIALASVLSWGLTFGTLVACFAFDYILALHYARYSGRVSDDSAPG